MAKGKGSVQHPYAKYAAMAGSAVNLARNAIWPSASAVGREVARGTVQRLGKKFAQGFTKTSLWRDPNARPPNATHSSTSRGFLKTKKRVKRRGKKNSILNKGVYKTVEKGAVVSCAAGSQTYFVGHTTGIYEEVIGAVCRAIFKALFDKAGVPIKNFSDSFSWPVTNDRIDLRYQTAQDAAISTSTYSYPGGTIEAWLDLFVADVLTQTNDDFKMYDITFIPTNPAATSNGIVPYTQMNLQNAKIQFDIKSTLKIQNRSQGVSAAGDENALDNVPLYGRGYSGWGTGTEYARIPTSATTPFYAARTTGMIFNTGTANNGTLEPPFAQLFRRAKREGKIHLDPGQIKTSVLTYRATKNLTWLCNQFNFLSTDTYPGFKFGNWRMFALEKMLNADTSTDFKYAYEHNCVLGARFIQGKSNNYTTMQFEVL